MSFEKIDPRIFASRNDAQDLRIGDLVHLLPSSPDAAAAEASLKSALGSSPGSEPPSRKFVLGGYPDDEGIRINNGRLGAALAPDLVRKHFFKMTPPLKPQRADFTITDFGNLNVSDLALADRHASVTSQALVALKQGATWVGIGGGHDYGFPDASAYIQWAQARGERPCILNFDAHLDVRPTHLGLSSGTPFNRMLETYPDIDFAEIGIQGHCNSRSHLDWAQSRGVRVLTQEEVVASNESFTTQVMRLIGDWALKPRSLFLSIDIDGFSSAIAPGCSQSWATGFDARDFFPCLDLLVSRFDIRALGIYEVSPPLDTDERTSKLAAQILHRVIT